MNEVITEYGRGLFSLAYEEGLEKEILSEIRIISPMMTDEYVHLLIDPEISKAERIALVEDAFGGRTHEYLTNFVKLMTERGIASEIQGCFREFERLYYETSGIVLVKAESTVELTDAQKEKLVEKLEKYLASKVEITYSLNPALIGGMRLSYNNKLIDDSISSKLKVISDRLSGTTV